MRKIKDMRGYFVDLHEAVDCIGQLEEAGRLVETGCVGDTRWDEFLYLVAFRTYQNLVAETIFKKLEKLLKLSN